jgi:hypothetical protein
MNDHIHRTLDRRAFLTKSAAVGAAAVGLRVLGLGAEEAFAGAGQGIRWGSTALPRSGQTQEEALRAFEQLVGRRFSTSHHRIPWTTSAVNNYSRWAVEGGRTPIISWFARQPSGGLVSWRAIADGGYDAWITEQARSLRAAGWSGFFCFHKEPEDEGNAADWKAAYARVRNIFANVGVTNFKWVVCLIAGTYAKDPAIWMPSAPWDLLGADACNRYRCTGRPWKSFAELFGPARTFARSRGKNLYIVEYGSVEGEAGRKAEWFDAARATMKSWPEIVGASYIHENTDCNFLVNTSSSSLSRFRAMGSDSSFQR